ncbi:MAG: YceI family protein [Acidobacteria bacterium]|nr:YceI family protein [Acidobacteriota bacterium]
MFSRIPEMRLFHCLIIMIIMLMLHGISSVTAQKAGQKADQKAEKKPQVLVYEIDQEQSRIIVHLVQEGLIARLHPRHEVAAQKFSGNVAMSVVNEADISVEVETEAASLTNIDTDMSDFERKEFHNILRNKVLECDKFPVIRFVAASVSDVKRSGANRSFNLNGDLFLHGTKRAVSLPVNVVIDGSVLKAQGEAKLKQSDFGIKPYTGGFGAIKIGDELKVSFQIVARKK